MKLIGLIFIFIGFSTICNLLLTRCILERCYLRQKNATNNYKPSDAFYLNAKYIILTIISILLYFASCAAAPIFNYVKETDTIIERLNEKYPED